MNVLINRTVHLLTRLLVLATRPDAPQALTRLLRESGMAGIGQKIQLELEDETLTILRGGAPGLELRWDEDGLAGRWEDGTRISEDDILVFVFALQTGDWTHTVRDVFARTSTPHSTFGISILPAIGQLSRALTRAHRYELLNLAAMIGSPLLGIKIEAAAGGYLIAKKREEAILRVHPDSEGLTPEYRTDLGWTPVPAEWLMR